MAKTEDNRWNTATAATTNFIGNSGLNFTDSCFYRTESREVNVSNRETPSENKGQIA